MTPSESPTPPTKKKPGRPKKPPVTPSLEGDDVGSIDLARAIQFAVENLNKTNMTPRKAGSKLRFALWQAGQADAKGLLLNLLPKAMTIIDKQTNHKVEDEETRREEAAVKEIDELLEAAIEEAAGL